ncbi:MAG: DUF2231 domain-containing protein [Bacteroidales bacterium]
MNTLPELIRTETWHPLLVHFPLALLLLGAIALLAGAVFSNVFFEKMGRIIIVLGTFGGGLAILTGNLADSVVSRQICDPTVLEAHETNAYITGALFTIASLLIILDYFGIFYRIRKFLKFTAIILSIAGSGFLMYTGHLGASLVYQQAAGVYTPSEDCNEFDD